MQLPCVCVCVCVCVLLSTSYPLDEHTCAGIFTWSMCISVCEHQEPTSQMSVFVMQKEGVCFPCGAA